jgi:hypothetical protein
VAINGPVAGELAGEEPRAEAGQRLPIVDLVAVEAEDPDVLPDIGLQVAVGAVGMVMPEQAYLRMAGRERGEAVRRGVLAQVVDDQQLVAKIDGVLDGPGDEVLFVADEDDADDAGGRGLRGLLISDEP